MERYIYKGKTRTIEVKIIPMQNMISGTNYFIVYEIERSHGGNRIWEHDTILNNKREIKERLEQLRERAGVGEFDNGN